MGYAIMMTDGQVSTDNMELVPWPWHVIDQLVGSVQQNSLVAKLDISADVSMNETEDEISSSKTVNDVTLKATNCQAGTIVLDLSSSGSSSCVTQSPVSTPSTPVELLDSKDINSAMKLPSTLVALSEPSSSETALSVSQSIASPNVATVKDKKETVTNLSEEDISILKDSNSVTNSSDRKRKSSDNVVVESSNKKISYGHTSRLQQHCPGKYKAFYTHVSLPTGSQKDTKVRCDLCSGGTILSGGNFGTHFRAFHLPPVTCEMCGMEVKASRVQFHKKKCAWKKLEFNEN